jgi:hypothetical protein
MISLSRIKRLENLKSPRIVAYLTRNGQRPVRIWSNQWHLWWRPGRCGYTDSIYQAGVYTLADALDASHHAGDEKEIYYEFLPEPTHA